MKKPRDILFERHRAVEAKLDAARQQALETIRNRSVSEKMPDCTEAFSWREWIISLRWHLTAISAVWVFVALLNMDYSSTFIPTITAGKTPAPKIIFTALIENRRQLSELIVPVETQVIAPIESTKPKPHSQRRPETIYV